mmetsp:Transcript_55680/g.62221  ORF Transcript_55680/g.62221 Transcript_55680/m.62221 type:complete len:791 (+) Transcript_55680:121-2493(+)
MTSSLQQIINGESDDECTFEYYDYEMEDEKKDDVDMQHVNVETIDDADDDYYTYEEEILEVVIEDDGEDLDSTAAPPPLPNRASKNALLSSSNNRSTRNNDTFKDSTVPLTPSKQRVQVASSTGLSELSKQLRILQATNESQAVDIGRLERQLRILAELQGISVSDLRKALEDACSSEAYGELQNRVSKLRFELEAATLAKRAELRKDAAAPQIANLELRIGELEEVEEASRRKIESLYTELRKESSETVRLESENQQLKKALQNMINRLKNETARSTQLETKFQNQMQQLRDDQSKRMYEEAERSNDKLNTVRNNSSTTTGARKQYSMISPQMASEYEQMVKVLNKKDGQLRGAQAKLHADDIRWAEKLKNGEERARKVQMDMKVEMDKLMLTVKELEDADGQSGLRLAQFKARFSVQDERIVDMGQQLDSLYTAFTLLKEEFDSENDRHTAMLSNLNDADAEIARQTNKVEKEKNDRLQRHNHEFPPTSGECSSDNATNRAALGSNSSIQSVPRFINASPNVVDNSILNTVMMAPVSPTTPNTIREYVNNSNDLIDNSNAIGYECVTPTTYASSRPFHPSPDRTPSTWQILFPKDQNQDQSSSSRSLQSGRGDQQPLISGSLLVESNSMLRKWKTKTSKIYLRGEGYQWDIGDKKSFPIQFGVSKVEFHPNHPLSFAVHLDPSSSVAPVIRAAAVNEHDYHRWMAALYKAASGVDYEGGPGTPVILSPPDSTPSRRFQYNDSSSAGRVSNSSRFSNGISTSSDSTRSIQSVQDAAELDRVLEISMRET